MQHLYSLKTEVLLCGEYDKKNMSFETAFKATNLKITNYNPKFRIFSCCLAFQANTQDIKDNLFSRENGENTKVWIS